MEYMCSKNEIVNLYFKAWLEYDLHLIDKIFTMSASYIILSRKKILRGKKQIETYWIRNSKRQKNLNLSWEVNGEFDDCAFTTFSAEFYDIELESVVSINGIISFLFEGNRISSLSEYYKKTTRCPN